MQEHSLQNKKEEVFRLQKVSIALLQKLISIPSFSGNENNSASYIYECLLSQNIQVQRHKNNIWARNKYFDKNKDTILLNSHHDTVQPNNGYSRDPFDPLIDGGLLFGLGSCDAGGALVSLLAAFLYFYPKVLNYNLVFAGTAEEETSGINGLESLLTNSTFTDSLSGAVSAIVGEPTSMQMAVAEKGLLVLDCTAFGKAGHAAREEGENAIYKVMQDIHWFRTFCFPKVSEFLGPVKMSVTSIESPNRLHNVVPSECRYIVDVRINEMYSLDEVVNIIQSNISGKVVPRSLRLKSSIISMEHPLVKAGTSIGLKCYGSPTTSDKALMTFPALKIGPGDSSRSHTSNEFIKLDEIINGILTYIDLLNKLL